MSQPVRITEPEQIPELPAEKGFVVIQKENLTAATRRITAFELSLLLLVAARTTSARKPRPKFANIDMQAWPQYSGAAERTIHGGITEAGMRLRSASCVPYPSVFLENVSHAVLDFGLL